MGCVLEPWCYQGQKIKHKGKEKMRRSSLLVLGFSLLVHSMCAAMQPAASPLISTTFCLQKENFNNPEMLDDAHHFCRKHTRNLVIIVDDNDLIRKCLIRQFQKKGYAIFEFTNGDDLLIALRNNEIGPALVSNARLLVLDNQMPGTKGIDVMTMIRRENLLQFDDGQRWVPTVCNSSDSFSDLELKQLEEFTLRLQIKNDIAEMLKVMDDNNSPVVKCRRHTL